MQLLKALFKSDRKH